MNRYLISVLAVVLLLARPVPALITTLSINPPNPQVGDSVQLVAEGLFPDACWALQGTDLQISGFDIDLTVEAIDTWIPSHACPLIIIPYGGTYELGQLPVGFYTVTVQESVSSVVFAPIHTIPFGLTAIPENCVICGSSSGKSSMVQVVVVAASVRVMLPTPNAQTVPERVGSTKSLVAFALGTWCHAPPS